MRDVEWGPWIEDPVITDDPMVKAVFQGSKVVFNNVYQVVIRKTFWEPIKTEITHLSIKRRDKEAIHDWRDLQRIKNELAGRDAEGVELYPNEDRLVDTSNQYHLWCLPPGNYWPIGFAEGRRVVDQSMKGAKQRPFGEGQTPADTMSEKDVNKLVDEYLKSKNKKS